MVDPQLMQLCNAAFASAQRAHAAEVTIAHILIEMVSAVDGRDLQHALNETVTVINDVSVRWLNDHAVASSGAPRTSRDLRRLLYWSQDLSQQRGAVCASVYDVLEVLRTHQEEFESARFLRARHSLSSGREGGDFADRRSVASGRTVEFDRHERHPFLRRQTQDDASLDAHSRTYAESRFDDLHNRPQQTYVRQHDRVDRLAQSASVRNHDTLRHDRSRSQPLRDAHLGPPSQMRSERDPRADMDDVMDRLRAQERLLAELLADGRHRDRGADRDRHHVHDRLPRDEYARPDNSGGGSRHRDPITARRNLDGDRDGVGAERPRYPWDQPREPREPRVPTTTADESRRKSPRDSFRQRLRQRSRSGSSSSRSQRFASTSGRTWAERDTTPYSHATNVETPRFADRRPRLVVGNNEPQRGGYAAMSAPRREARDPDEGGDERTKRFYLSLDDLIVRAPSIGAKTALKFEAAGYSTVRDFLRADPNRGAAALASRFITPQRFADWQAQARLVCTIPWLRGTHAQMFVGAGFKDVDQITGTELAVLHDAIRAFAATRDGQSVLRSGPVPDADQIKKWVSHAAQAETARAA